VIVNTGLGFSIHEGVFDRTAMLEVLAALDRAELTRTRAGARHVLAVPAVRALASAPAIVQIAREYVGLDAFPYRATLFDKSIDSNWLVTWHQDTALPIQRKADVAGWGPWSWKGGVLHAIAPAAALDQVIALRIHLDDSTSGNGPLRVLPGTHAHGVLSHNEIEALSAAVTPVECLVATGGVVTMRPLTVHASSKARGDQPRRVLHVEFAAAVRLDRGIELAVG
jgi:ectoine hydroxylase-related dioxygenase (phytanoyl-CoA dioxygenase family)